MFLLPIHGGFHVYFSDIGVHVYFSDTIVHVSFVDTPKDFMFLLLIH
jgi:hypothetical protein